MERDTKLSTGTKNILKQYICCQSRESCCIIFPMLIWTDQQDRRLCLLAAVFPLNAAIFNVGCLHVQETSGLRWPRAVPYGGLQAGSPCCAATPPETPETACGSASAGHSCLPDLAPATQIMSAGCWAGRSRMLRISCSLLRSFIITDHLS